MRVNSICMSVIALMALTLSISPAYADCINPAGVKGQQIYNTTYDTMQFCTGSEWHSMDASTAGGGFDNLGDHTAVQTLDMDWNKVANVGTPSATGDATPKSYVDGLLATVHGLISSLSSVLAGKADVSALTSGLAGKADTSALADKVNKAGDVMSGALTLSGAPTGNAHAASKEYVDTVMAAGGGGSSSGGGGGGTCYYTNGSCGQGFSQMPGVYNPYSGANQKICCSSGFFAVDTVPNSITIAYGSMGAGYLYTAAIFQVVGITTANISVSGDGSPEYRLCNDASCSNVASGWASSVRTVNESQYVQVRSTASVTDGNILTSTLNVGDASDSWTVTTDNIPDSFDIVDNVAGHNAPYTSATAFHVTGIGAADISVSGGGSPEYRICANAACSSVLSDWSGAAGTVNDGYNVTRYVQVRSTAGAVDGDTTSTLTIGGLSDSWIVTALDCKTSVGALCEDGTFYIGELGGNKIFVAGEDEASQKTGHNIFSTTTPNVSNMCLNKTDDGHSDWFFPSMAQLTLLWDNRVASDMYNRGIDFNERYWSRDYSAWYYRRYKYVNNGTNGSTTAASNDPAIGIHGVKGSARCFRQEPI